jgi:hypothetical protein
MRSFSRALRCGLLAVLVEGCAIPLEDTVDPVPSQQVPPTGQAPAVAPGCLLFFDPARPFISLRASGQSLDAGDGHWLWLFESVQGSDTSWPTPGAIVSAGPASDCFSGVPFDGSPSPAPHIDTATLGPDGFVAPLDGARTASGSILYVSVYKYVPEEPFGVRAEGLTVAQKDESTGQYRISPTFLWTADRPSFGTSVLVDRGFVYAYGCRTIPGTLSAHCFVARAPEAEVDVRSSYRYFDGGGNWIADIELAAPIAEAGSAASVRRYPGQDRYLMSYVPPLGNTIVVRAGLGPEGPWSAPVPAATCDVPADDPGAFCAGAVQHPEIAAGPAGAIAVSYSIASLSSDAAARIQAARERYWPRLAIIPWPQALP